MIGDIRKDLLCYPARDNFGTEFYGWVLYTTSTVLMERPIKSRCIELLPNVSEIIQTASIYKKRIENPDALHTDEITMMNELLAKERRCYDSLAVYIGGRSLYRTSNRYLGLGPDSMRVGDEVWALQSTHVLFVLRKSENNAKYRLVGEAYLHGFMQGEMLDGVLQLQIGRIAIL